MEAKTSRPTVKKVLKDPRLAGFVMPSGHFVPKSEYAQGIERFKTAVGISPKDVFSEQIKDDQLVAMLNEQGTVPPYDLEALRSALKISTVHYRCVKAKASDTVGAWHIGPKKEKELPDAQEVATVERFLETAPTDVESFSELLERVQMDIEAIGFGILEVGRGLDAKVSKLWHLPAYTVRYLKTGDFLQVRGINKRHFQRFPRKATVKENGKIEWNLMDPVSGGKPKFTDPLKAANELLVVANYHPLSEVYGLPDFITASPAMLGNLLASDFNINRFTNWMVPAYAVLITGGYADEPMRQLIEKYFEDLKGSGRDTLVLSIPGKDSKIDFKKLEADVEEASFAKYMKDNRDEVLLAHGVHPARIGIIETAQLGGGSAEAQLRHYKNAIITPRQRRMTGVCGFLFTHGLSCPNVTVVFEPPDIVDRVLQAEVLCEYVDRKIITRNEARAELGRVPLQLLDSALLDPDWATKPSAPTLKALSVTKALGRRDRLDAEREALMTSYKSIWDGLDLKPGMTKDDVKTARSKLRRSLFGVSLLSLDRVLKTEAALVNEDYGLTVSPEAVQPTVEGLFNTYIGGTWLDDFEDQAGRALDMPDEEVPAAFAKIKKSLTSRAAMYAGLLAAASALIMVEVGKSLGKRLQWVTLDDKACVNCKEEEAKGPRPYSEFTRYPGDGSTICRGHCRCVLTMEGEG